MIIGLRNALGAAGAFAVLFLGICAIIALCVWGAVEISALISGPTGAAGQKQFTNSTQNRTEAQYQFGQDTSAIRVDVGNISQAIENYKEDPTNYQLSLVQAAASQCSQDVSQYNTLSSGVTSAPWRPAGDPVAYDATKECAYTLP